ncbi:hypothetical protein C8F01DRAFT_1348089, partial [Mycena amicta]
MHPSYGLAYFDQMEWPKEWKDTAVSLARMQWTENYRVETLDTPAVATSTPATIFDSLDVTPVNADPFEHLLASPSIPLNNCQKPLLWFATLSPYAADPSPNSKALIRMAHDFLGAPATSVNIEHAFSHGGGMVTKWRHALSAETIRANALVSAWHREDLIPEAVAIDKLSSRNSRKKKKKDDVIELASEDGES